jgi:tetratricopeptide (TPR) repeat protein
MLLLSRKAGISCDEVLHFDHSIAVYDFFASGGNDLSALDTPETNLKYYGQSYDNFTTLLIRILNIEDVFRFRHYMSSVAGWAVIILTALFALWLSGFEAGMLVMFLFMVSPTFIGHAMNNLKDVPFSLAYIAGIFFSVRIVTSENGFKWSDIILLILSIAFAISLRAGGLLLICYLFLFYSIVLITNYLIKGGLDWKVEIKEIFILILISFAAFFLGILQWPFALQDPLRNVLEAYKVMAHYPLTFRQLFEGSAQWSDFMPWYFIPKSMLITIPVVVTAGIIIFFFFIKKICWSGKGLIFSFLLLSLFFPLVFVAIIKSNVYSSWRQFLFLYPVMILLSASGFIYLSQVLKKSYMKFALALIIAFLAYHPVRFSISNHPYEYIYYNQLTGGLKGAYGNYETDYYYTGQTEASEWLISYLNDNDIDSALVKATFSVDWSFRKHPGIKTSYFRYEERSQYDWDYAIITNRYIPPYQLKNNIWPPANTIYKILVDDVPICVVLKRDTKANYIGYKALAEGRYSDAIRYFQEALNFNDRDEMIFYNFARALNGGGFSLEADSALSKALQINPDSEPVLMYCGNLAAKRNEGDKAVMYYERLLSVNRKYYEAYVKLSGLIVDKDLLRARELLRDCLRLNPHYKPAIIALGDTYSKSDPLIAEKYYKMADTIIN